MTPTDGAKLHSMSNLNTALWREFNRIVNEFGSTQNIVGEFAERLIIAYYESKGMRSLPTPPSQKSFDIELDNGEKIQVKARRLGRGQSLSDFRSFEFDYLAVVMFGKDGEVDKAVIVPKEVADELKGENKPREGRYVITASKNLLNHNLAQDITDELNMIMNSSSL